MDIDDFDFADLKTEKEILKNSFKVFDQKWRLHVTIVFDKWEDTANMDRRAWVRFEKDILNFKLEFDTPDNY